MSDDRTVRSRRVPWAAVALLGLSACSGEPASDHHSVLIITVDTTRADHLGCYGYPIDITPNMDRLAERGVLFENAYAPMPQTLPSHVTLFTGLEPRQHRTLENTYSLAPEYQTLAEFARDEGYATGAFIGALAVEKATGIDQGFDVFDQPAGDWGEDKRGHPPERSAKEVTDSALAWADELDGDRPYLMWAHYYDPHGDPGGGFKAPPAHLEAVPRARVRDVIRENESELASSGYGEDQLLPYWHGYAAGVRYTDEQLGRLLDGLEERGLLDHTVIVLAGDHGEGLWEHGQKSHGTHVWEEMLRIPLILVDPHGVGAGKRYSARVTLRDIEPTVKHMAMGIPGESRDIEYGLDLWAAVGQGVEPVDRPVFLERPHFDEERIAWRGKGKMQYGFLTAVLVGDYKLVREPDGRSALYHLPTDPEEHRDISAQEPETAARLRDLLVDWIDRNDVGLPGEDVEISPERLENLRALGYVK